MTVVFPDSVAVAGAHRQGSLVFSIAFILTIGAAIWLLSLVRINGKPPKSGEYRDVPGPK